MALLSIVCKLLTEMCGNGWITAKEFDKHDHKIDTDGDGIEYLLTRGLLHKYSVRDAQF